MAAVTVNFNGIWKVYLGDKSPLCAANLDDAMLEIERTFGPKFKEKWEGMGMKGEGGILQYSSLLLNGKNVKNLNERNLKDGDVLDVLLPVFGG
jgi:hypothetical protein